MVSNIYTDVIVSKVLFLFFNLRFAFIFWTCSFDRFFKAVSISIKLSFIPFLLLLLSAWIGGISRQNPSRQRQEILSPDLWNGEFFRHFLLLSLTNATQAASLLARFNPKRQRKWQKSVQIIRRVNDCKCETRDLIARAIGNFSFDFPPAAPGASWEGSLLVYDQLLTDCFGYENEHRGTSCSYSMTGTTRNVTGALFQGPTFTMLEKISTSLVEGVLMYTVRMFLMVYTDCSKSFSNWFKANVLECNNRSLWLASC